MVIEFIYKGSGKTRERPACPGKHHFSPMRTNTAIVGNRVCRFFPVGENRIVLAVASIVMCVFFLLAGSGNASGKVLHADSVQLCKSPIVRGDSLIYTLDIFFQEEPKNFWSYYDKILKYVVIEFFDVLVLAPEVSFPYDCPLKELRVKSVETKTALTGRMSRIEVAIDQKSAAEQFWFTDVQLLNKSTMRITIWKKMMSYQKLMEKKKSNVMTIGISVLVLSMTLLTVIIVVLNLNLDSKK
jgi:hypothetical protein